MPKNTYFFFSFVFVFECVCGMRMLKIHLTFDNKLYYNSVYKKLFIYSVFGICVIVFYSIYIMLFKMDYVCLCMEDM